MTWHPKTVSDSSFSCEWNPDQSRAARGVEPWHADAEILLGADGRLRVCRTCSIDWSLERLARRTPLVPVDVLGRLDDELLEAVETKKHTYDRSVWMESVDRRGDEILLWWRPQDLRPYLFNAKARHCLRWEWIRRQLWYELRPLAVERFKVDSSLWSVQGHLAMTAREARAGEPIWVEISTRPHLAASVDPARILEILDGSDADLQSEAPMA